MAVGAFKNVAVSELTGSAWLAGFNRSTPNVLDAVTEAVLDAFSLEPISITAFFGPFPFYFWEHFSFTAFAG
jgi:hypothetical protein